MCSNSQPLGMRINLLDNLRLWRIALTIIGAVLLFATGVQAADMAKHNHPDEQIPATVVRPHLDLNLMKDAMDGFNLQLVTRDYRMLPPGFTPESTNKANDGILHGHAHLFINGEKIGRVYGEFVHIPAQWLGKPVNQLTIFLNSDSHGIWKDGNKQVLATLFINPKAAEPVVHKFVTFP